MAKKRGTTDLSLMVAVDKPSGMTSHDVVNRVRRIFGSRRVGHTGTAGFTFAGTLVQAVDALAERLGIECPVRPGEGVR